jgi:hypothetical protein
MNQKQEGDDTDGADDGSIESRFAELIRRFWQPPRQPGPTTKGGGANEPCSQSIEPLKKGKHQ